VNHNRDIEWLRRALDSLDLVFFESHMAEYPVTIKWMRWKPCRSGGEFLYATYLEGVIEINRALAWDWVPDFVVMSTVYHECLHHFTGHDHDLAFKFAEQKFPHYTEALLWERENLAKLLAAPKPF